MDSKLRTELEAGVFRRLLQHLDKRKDVQNIELMILAGFCRNCLSKWYVEAAVEHGSDIGLDDARELVYGMPYSEWKDNHQPVATDEQLSRFEEAQKVNK
ncbi:MAG: deoxycytidine triphosphate deaminase [Gammaproteobacteria bacterium]|nr:deoxycytidine triphosphate deaminase [Gammaproteobacteria bacterium]